MGEGLIIYSKKIILSAVENIYWRRKRLGSGGSIKREETMNPERCGVAFSGEEN